MYRDADEGSRARLGGVNPPDSRCRGPSGGRARLMALRLDARDPDFPLAFNRLLATKREVAEDVDQAVRVIIEDVISRGDAAVIECTRRFDELDLAPEALRVGADEIAAAEAQCPPEALEALRLARERIEVFHRRQRPEDSTSTDAIAPVAKIVGPGNAYVAAAKRRVFGQVGIDMIAGPSEVLILADGHANPDWIAADLLAQAEHDTAAQSILITDSPELAEAVQSAVERQLAVLPRE